MAVDDLERKLHDLDQIIEQMKSEGDRAAEAVAHSQQALLYAMSMDLSAAAEAIARAGALAQEEGRFQELAQAYLAQGKALVAQPAQREKAEDLLDNAAALYHTLEDEGREAESLQALATLDINAEHYERAIERLTRAIELLGAADEPERMIELQRLLSRCHLLHQEPEAALADLEAALDVAQDHECESLAVEIRVEQHTLRTFFVEGVTGETLDALLEQAQRAEALQALGDLRLWQAAEAVQAGDYRRALEQAQAVRRVAREAHDLPRFVRYLMGSLLMAEAQEGLGDRVGVLAALLTCRAYLTAHLGEDVGSRVDLFLDALERRWGREALVESVRAYKQRAKTEGPYRV